MQKFKGIFSEVRLLLKSIPPLSMTLFVFSVIMMNLMANKSISLPFDWLALDCGILLSWLTCLLMDMIVPRFGPRAATYLSIMAMLINLFFALILFLLGQIPGVWGQSYVPGMESVINQALDNTFAGTWYVLAGSSLAFLISSVVNNVTNHVIGRMLQGQQSFRSFAIRSYVSTFLGQFTDNLVFALMVSYFFFDWSLMQCLTCALTGSVAELLCEVLFSPIGYRVARSWERDGVGSAYLDHMRKKYCKEQAA